jgi:hypothetical protein
VEEAFRLDRDLGREAGAEAGRRERGADELSPPLLVVLDLRLRSSATTPTSTPPYSRLVMRSPNAPRKRTNTDATRSAAVAVPSRVSSTT